MLYKNKFNYNKKVSGLGFGCMRFPMKNNEIDLEQTQKMFDLAIEQGITYFDTAYNYHGGKSELICGKCLKKYERESFSIATKLPCWLVDSVEKAESLFNEQLEKLQMDYVDFYLLHSLSGKKFDELVAMGIVEWGKSKKAEGIIPNNEQEQLTCMTVIHLKELIAKREIFYRMLKEAHAFLTLRIISKEY